MIVDMFPRRDVDLIPHSMTRAQTRSLFVFVHVLILNGFGLLTDFERIQNTTRSPETYHRICTSETLHQVFLKNDSKNYVFELPAMLHRGICHGIDRSEQIAHGGQRG